MAGSSSPEISFDQKQSILLFICGFAVAIDTLSVLARTIGKDVFSPLAAECVQLGLNLTDTIDDPDLRRCTYVLYLVFSCVCLPLDSNM